MRTCLVDHARLSLFVLYLRLCFDLLIKGQGPTMLCNVCNDDIYDGDNLNCNKCNVFLHFGCAALRETAFRKMSNTAKQTWCCNKCKFKEQSPKTLASKSNLTTVYSGTQKVNNETLNNLVDSVNFMSDKFDDFGKQLQDVISIINLIKEENSSLKEENRKMKNEFASLEKRLNVIEQKSIENIFEIVGVPEIENEDCVKTVESIAAAVGAKIFVSKAYRAYSKNSKRSRKIVAESTSIQDKRSLMEGIKKSKLTGKTVNSKWNNDSIYINDALTQFNKNLFFKTRVFAREAGYKFTWFKDSKIFIKKNENTKACIIFDELSLSKLV